MIWTLTILAFLTASAVYPLALRFARKHNIVDCPDARKLQKTPVPVLGGVVVVCGMLIPTVFAAQYYHFSDLWYIICSIFVLCAIGTTDDVRGLPAWLRFTLETLLIWVFIWHPNAPDNGLMINSLHGIWGRDQLSLFTAIPLTLVAGVGIINSINLIDGVDGYSSGFGILSSTLFGVLFLHVGNEALALFGFVCAAALVPFYLHNVFGRTSKMFIGDGGSLVIGMVLTYDTFALLCAPSPAASLTEQGISLVALALAILCIPVFDTLRVMFGRMLHGIGPFNPDKTHLHHIFIDMGFSHVGTSTTILFINSLIILLWYLSYRLGLSITGQFYLVCTLGVLATCGIYYGCRYAGRRQNRFWHTMCRLGQWTHMEQKNVWNKIETLLDKLA